MTKKNMGLVRVAAAVPRVRVANPVENAREIAECIQEAAARGAGFILFPELCLTGATAGDLLFQTRLYEGQLEALSALLKETADLDLCILLGVALRVRGKLAEGTLLIQKGCLKGFTPKDFIEGESEEIRLLGQDLPVGALVFTDEENRVDVAMEGFELCGYGASIIFDASSRAYAEVDAYAYRRKRVEVISSENACGYVYVTPGTGESPTDHVYPGQVLIGECGHILAEDRGFRLARHIVYTEIDLDKIRFERASWEDFGPADQVALSPVPMVSPAESLFRKYPKSPFVPEDPALRASRCEEIFSIQSVALAGRLAHTGCAKLVLGLSGGLDSTLALLVCAQALDLLGKDREDLIAVTMPGFGTSGGTYASALALADFVGAQLREIPIGPAVGRHFEDIGHDPLVHNTTFENDQARERTQVLMDLANDVNGLVVGTGDLSEVALGWCTFNGDHMAMYGVNGGVPKTLIASILRWAAANRPVGRPGTHPEALLSIVDAIESNPISPELLPPDGDGTISQKTEEKLGPYALHEFFLY